MSADRVAAVMGLRRIPVECAQCGALTSVGASDKGAVREAIDAGLLVVWCQNCTPADNDHLDSDGYRRRSNEWGFNSFVDADECEASIRKAARKRSHWYLWRLSDGTYTHTAIKDVTDLDGSYTGAEIIREFDV